MKRITRKNLDNLCDHLNKLTGNNIEPWTQDENGRNKANIGTYYISGAYGGWELCQLVNESGGASDVLSSGHVPARELFNLIHAYLKGMEVMGLYKEVKP
tara:strand:+ start:1525 stop:1824 length:300 start_codon:yes stop_codon:yes gene_type:complete